MFSFPNFFKESSSDSFDRESYNTNFLKGMSLLNRAESLANTSMGIYANKVRSRMQENRLNLQAMFQDLEAQQAETNAIEQGNAIRNQLLNNMAATTAMFAARGFDPGSSEAMNIASRRRAMEDILNVRDQGKLNAIQARSAAMASRTDAKIASAFGRFERAGMKRQLVNQGLEFIYGARGLIGG